MPFVNVRGIEIWCERVGTGPKLLAIYGTGGDLRREPNLLRTPLPRHFEVLAYDQRGLGRSSKPDEKYTMAGFADDAAALLDEFRWERAAVVGVSFGGMVAQELAIRHPARVARLALCCTSAGGAGGASFPLLALQALDPEERARRMIAISDLRRDAAWAAANPQLYRTMLKALGDDPFAAEPGRLPGASRQLEARAHHDTWDRLDRIRCPTFVGGGRFDGIASPQSVENLATRIPGARLRFYDGGHLYLWEDPAAWPDLSAFLAGA
jgi:3-oxoadipate enol-lactonase